MAVDDTVIVELTEPDEVDVSVADIVEEYEKCVVDDGVDEIVVKELCEPLLEGDPVSEAEEVLECVIVILDVYEDDWDNIAVALGDDVILKAADSVTCIDTTGDNEKGVVTEFEESGVEENEGEDEEDIVIDSTLVIEWDSVGVPVRGVGIAIVNDGVGEISWDSDHALDPTVEVLDGEFAETEGAGDSESDEYTDAATNGVQSALVDDVTVLLPDEHNDESRDIDDFVEKVAVIEREAVALNVGDEEEVEDDVSDDVLVEEAVVLDDKDGKIVKVLVPVALVVGETDSDFTLEAVDTLVSVAVDDSDVLTEGDDELVVDEVLLEVGEIVLVAVSDVVEVDDVLSVAELVAVSEIEEVTVEEDELDEREETVDVLQLLTDDETVSVFELVREETDVWLTIALLEPVTDTENVEIAVVVDCCEWRDSVDVGDAADGVLNEDGERCDEILIISAVSVTLALIEIDSKMVEETVTVGTVVETVVTDIIGDKVVRKVDIPVGKDEDVKL